MLTSLFLTTNFLNKKLVQWSPPMVVNEFLSPLSTHSVIIYLPIYLSLWSGGYLFVVLILFNAKIVPYFAFGSPSKLHSPILNFRLLRKTFAKRTLSSHLSTFLRNP